MALGIVSANNKYIPVFPSLPEQVKVGFSFCPCICLAENNLPVGYNSAGLLGKTGYWFYRLGKYSVNYNRLG
jgi:hypothetical protein